MYRSLALLLAVSLFAGGVGFAQNKVPEQLRSVGIDQRLNNQVPLNLSFRDENGREVQLSRYFGSRPVVLSLVYYECPMLCTMILNGLLRGIRAVKLDVNEHYDIVTVSIDPRETPDLAAAKKKEYVKKYGRAGAGQGWHFLTGDEASIKRLADSVGFRYNFDEKSGQFAHASGIMILTPEGRLSRYLYGIEYSPTDLRLGLVEASAGKIGSPVDQVLLYCFHYDPSTGKYSLLIMKVIRSVGAATVVALGLFMFTMFRRDRRRKLKQNVNQVSIVS